MHEPQNLTLCTLKFGLQSVNKHKEEGEEEATHALVTHMTSLCGTWAEPHGRQPNMLSPMRFFVCFLSIRETGKVLVFLTLTCA